MSHLVGCSVRGPSHEDEGIPCQDSWCVRELSDGRFLVAVGDGLGSAHLSHEGSRIATETVVDELAEYVDALGPDDGIDDGPMERVFADAFESTRNELARVADERGEPVSAFHTTLLTVAGGSSGIAGAATGDGGIVFGNRGNYDPLVPPEIFITDFTADHKTYPVTSGGWQESYRFEFRESFDEVAVFSDGLGAWAWDNDAENYVHSSFFSNAFEEFVHEASDLDAAAGELERILNNDNFRDDGDDKTIVLGAVGSGGSAGDKERKFLSGPADDVDLAVVEDVRESQFAIELSLTLPGGAGTTLRLKKPAVQDVYDNQYEKILDAYSLGPESVDRLEGVEIPCKIDSSVSPPYVALNDDALATKDSGRRVEQPEFSGLDLNTE